METPDPANAELPVRITEMEECQRVFEFECHGNVREAISRKDSREICAASLFHFDIIGAILHWDMGSTETPIDLKNLNQKKNLAPSSSINPKGESGRKGDSLLDVAFLFRFNWLQTAVVSDAGNRGIANM